MLPSYFIFSLPRSGTSWLSLFLTDRSSYCYHEPTADFTPHEWVRRAANRPETVGAIDTGAARYDALIRAAAPHARLFVLLRDPEEIKQSLNYAGMLGFDVDEAYEQLHALKLDPIYYRNFGSEGYLAALWRHLNGTECEPAHVDRYLELRVERDARLFMAHRPNLNAHLRRMLS